MTYTLDDIKNMMEKITQGEWEYCIIESTGEYGVHVKDDPESKVLPDGTIGNGFVICKGMTGTNKINNSTFIASAPSIVRQLVEENEYLADAIEDNNEKIDRLQADNEKLKEELIHPRRSEACMFNPCQGTYQLELENEKLRKVKEAAEKYRDDGEAESLLELGEALQAAKEAK